MHKPIPRLINCMLLLIGLTACASNPTSHSVRSTPPTVECSEHAPGEPLPAYPVGPQLRGHETAQQLLARAAPASDYARALANADADIVDLKRYNTAQTGWAIRTAGIVQRDHIRRATTANCLDANRARGIIH